jgi:hypothetical protein
LNLSTAIEAARKFKEEQQAVPARADGHAVSEI